MELCTAIEARSPSFRNEVQLSRHFDSSEGPIGWQILVAFVSMMGSAFDVQWLPSSFPNTLTNGPVVLQTPSIASNSLSPPEVGSYRNYLVRLAKTQMRPASFSVVCPFRVPSRGCAACGINQRLMGYQIALAKYTRSIWSKTLHTTREHTTESRTGDTPDLSGQKFAYY